MIIISIGLTVFGALPRYVYYIYKFINGNARGLFLPSLITLNIYIFANGLYFFIYFKFNKLFRKIFLSYLKLLNFNKK